MNLKNAVLFWMFVFEVFLHLQVDVAFARSELEKKSVHGEAPVKQKAAEKTLPMPEMAAESNVVTTEIVAEIDDPSLSRRETKITSREVKMNAIVEEILFSSETVKDRITNIEDSKKFQGEIDRVLTEWVVFLESKSFSFSDIVDSEVSQSEKRFFAALSKSAFQKTWNQLEVQVRELPPLIRRKLKARKFLDFKNKASRVPVTEAEVKKHFETNKKKFGSVPFESVKDNIRTFLMQNQAQDRMKAWLEVLLRKYKARRILNASA